MALRDKIKSAKDKLERKTFQKKAETRARERRIEKREPEGALEEAVVTGKETKELGSQAKEFVSEAAPGSGIAAEKTGGILSSIGEGAAQVSKDAESGELDVFDDMGGSNAGSLDDQLGIGMSSGGDLDMDLEDFD